MVKLFKRASIKYNFMACVSSLAIRAFALNSWSNTLLHKFFLKKKTSENSRRNIKKDIVSAIIFYYMYIEIIFTIKHFSRTDHV